MRRSNRTTKCRLVLPILHPSRVPPSSRCTNLFTKYPRIPKYVINPTLIQPTDRLMKQLPPMTSVHNSIHSKDTPVWPSPMTTKSACRSPDRRLNGPRSRTTKTRGLRHTTNHHPTKPNDQLYGISLPNIIPLRHDYNKLNLPSPNRPQITDRILISKPHSPCNRSYPHPNTMKLYRSNSPNNRTRPYLLHAILPRQHQL